LKGIADSDARFNVIDVIDPSLPMQKFLLAAVGETCAVIAVVHGGFVEFTTLTEYRWGDSGWAATSEIQTHGYPKSVHDLLTWQEK
jgi:hypothetical protein